MKGTDKSGSQLQKSGHEGTVTYEIPLSYWFPERKKKLLWGKLLSKYAKK